ncbi:hypothetical protein DKX15_19250, partial [Enterococcus faecium]
FELDCRLLQGKHVAQGLERKWRRRPVMGDAAEHETARLAAIEAVGRQPKAADVVGLIVVDGERVIDVL